MRHPRWIGFVFQMFVRLIGAARFTRASAGWVAMLAMCATVVLWQPVTGSEFPIRTWSDARLRLPEMIDDPQKVEVAQAPQESELTAPPVVAPKLDKEQTHLAQFIAQRYRVALDKTQVFVDSAYKAAREYKMDPWLILAVMAVESSFDPSATSPAGAHGLMQVLTKVHAEKFKPFGGIAAAFDPIANVKVGAQILREYITRDGSIEAALKSYVGAALMGDDSGYGNKVLAERERLAAVAAGKPLPPPPAPKPAVAAQGSAGDIVETVVPEPGPAIARSSAEPAPSVSGTAHAAAAHQAHGPTAAPQAAGVTTHGVVDATP